MKAGRLVVVDPGGALTERLRAAGLDTALELTVAAGAHDLGRCDVLVASGAVATVAALFAEARRQDPDRYLVHACDAVPDALAALEHGGSDAVLRAWQGASELKRQLLDACEEVLERRHQRAVLEELAGSNRELSAALEARSASRAHAPQLLRQQHDELVRLETQAVVSHLARGLAHELNNPLAAILGYAQRLRRTHAHDNEAVRRLDVILGEVDRCQSLVEQLRNLATPLEEGLIACQPQRLLVEALARRRDSGSAVPRLEVVEPVPAVMAAPQALMRVFEQLIDNAHLAGATRIAFSGAQAGSRVRLMLENDGAIPDEQTTRNATRPFFTTWAASGHRGLGLAIALALLRDQAGALELAKAAGGQGAASIITLPASAEPPAEPLTANDDALRAQQVLVVDDEPLVAELLLDALREFGLGGRVVGTVDEALAAVRAGEVRALIIDVRLPDGSGIALASEVLRLRPELAGHLALVTGSGDVAGLRLPAGADWPVLSKPFRMEQIAGLVRTIA